MAFIQGGRLIIDKKPMTMTAQEKCLWRLGATGKEGERGGHRRGKKSGGEFLVFQGEN